jgi:hypothetical protein
MIHKAPPDGLCEVCTTRSIDPTKLESLNTMDIILYKREEVTQVIILDTIR